MYIYLEKTNGSFHQITFMNVTYKNCILSWKLNTEGRVKIPGAKVGNKIIQYMNKHKLLTRK